MKVIDARGLSCPEPVVLLRAAMQSGEAAGDVERIAAWDGRSYTPVYQRMEE